MSPGEYLITIFVLLIFILGIYGGIKLLRWNLKDMKAKEKRNQKKRNNKIS